MSNLETVAEQRQFYRRLYHILAVYAPLQLVTGLMAITPWPPDLKLHSTLLTITYVAMALALIKLALLFKSGMDTHRKLCNPILFLAFLYVFVALVSLNRFL
jgi:hypothetical protein